MRPIILVIMDGLGINNDEAGNAVAAAKTPVLDRVISNYPSTKIGASGQAVGLPEGQMGNSEVGHLNLGAGRIIYQNYSRINKAIESGEFSKNTRILGLMDAVKEEGSSLHLMGLVSDGGVHSHINHLYRLIDMAKERGLKKVFLHAFLDGRDTPPRSGKGYIEALESYIEKCGVGKVASVMGRFYAMDRDNRWERVKEAYATMVEGGDRHAGTAAEAVEISYGEGEGDEFVPPTIVNRKGCIEDGDSIIFFNFRADRAREITRAFTETKFPHFGNLRRPRINRFLCLTEYDATFDLPIAFSPVMIDRTLGQVVSEKGIRQLRIAETEKYAHVTFFFNGGEEAPCKGEERILVPSPKDVRTYDEKPGMSAVKITDEVVRSMEKGSFGLIVLNYANCDMVGHTGVFSAAVEAVETVDSCLGRVLNTAKTNNYRVLVTADHGNAEQMLDSETGHPHTAHTTNPVHFVLVDDEMKEKTLRKGGILADVAPTILELFGIEKPGPMEGRSLIEYCIKSC